MTKVQGEMEILKSTRVLGSDKQTSDKGTKGDDLGEKSTAEQASEVVNDESHPWNQTAEEMRDYLALPEHEGVCGWRRSSDSDRANVRYMPCQWLQALVLLRFGPLKHSYCAGAARLNIAGQ